MKKIILAIALITSVGFFSEAKVQQDNDTMIETSVSQDDGFVTIKIEELNVKVQAAINSYSEEYNLKSLAYNVEKNLTKVTLESKDGQSSKTILLDDEGKEA